MSEDLDPKAPARMVMRWLSLSALLTVGLVAVVGNLLVYWKEVMQTLNAGVLADVLISGSISFLVLLIVSMEICFSENISRQHYKLRLVAIVSGLLFSFSSFLFLCVAAYAMPNLPDSLMLFAWTAAAFWFLASLSSSIVGLGLFFGCVDV